MRTIYRVLCLLLYVLLVSCAAASPAAPIPTVLPAATAISTPTGLPTATTTTAPTASPTAAASPDTSLAIPPGLEPITQENADRITQLAMLGYGYATDVAWSPDNKLLAAGTSAGVLLYDTTTLEVAPRWQEVSVGYVNRVAFSPDGSSLAIAGRNGLILWNVADGQEKAALQSGTEVIGVAFSPTGTILAAGGPDGIVRLWDVATGQALFEIKGDSAAITEVVFSLDGTKLAASSGNDRGAIHLWSVATGELLDELGDGTDKYGGVAFSPDGATLASGGYDNTVRLWEIATGTLRAAMKGHTGDVMSVAFSPDGALLASSAGWADSSVRLWDVATGNLVRTLEGCKRPAHVGEIGRVAFSPDGERLASTCSGFGVMLWDVGTGQAHLLSKGLSSTIYDMAFSPDGALLVTSEYWASNDVHVWDVAAGTELIRLKGHTATVPSVAFSPRGSILASGSHDGTVRLWNVATGETVLVLKRPDRPGGGTFESRDDDGNLVDSGVWDTAAVWSVGFSPDGATIAVGRGDPWVGPGSMEMYDVATGELLFEFEPSRHFGCCEMVSVYDLAFSPDGTLLATANGDGSITLWDTAIGHERTLLDNKSLGLPGSLVFSPDGTRLAAAVGDIRFWDVATGDQLTLLNESAGHVRSVTFSPDGALLASAGDDGMVRLWNALTGDLLAALETELAMPIVAFSPDGRLLAVSSLDGAVCLWGVASK